MNTNFGKKFIKKVFDLDNSRFDLVCMIKNSTTNNFLRDNPETNEYITPFAPFNNNFKIVLNSDKFRDNPKLVITSTIIHETIPIYLKLNKVLLLGADQVKRNKKRKLKIIEN